VLLPLLVVLVSLLVVLVVLLLVLLLLMVLQMQLGLNSASCHRLLPNLLMICSQIAFFPFTL
jgi:hypothetical protein